MLKAEVCLLQGGVCLPPVRRRVSVRHRVIDCVTHCLAHWSVRCLVVLPLVGVLLGSASALADVTRFRGGVRNSPDEHRLSAKQLNEVLKSLRAKTGWSQLIFDAEGFLICPEPELFKGGSAAARKLLNAALTSSEAFDLEVFNHSAEVAFARLAASIQYESRRTGVHISAHPLQLDLTDFYELRGDGDAMKAFDVGLVILHELAHGVWHLRDAVALAEEPGECESYINGIRRELGLPERTQYQARVRAGTINFSPGNVLVAELGFARQTDKQGQPRQQRFYLQWQAEAVGAVRLRGLAQTPEVLATFQ